MILDLNDISKLDKVFRLNLINSITGIKPASLIGTMDSSGITNLGIFSSVVHLGSNPPLLGFIARPSNEIRRDTLENILDNKYYTINHLTTDLSKNGHYTSVKFPKEISEFEKCKFTEEFTINFQAPFVQESPIKYGLEFVEKLDIKHNNTSLIIGEIKIISIHKTLISEEGYIDLEKSNSAEYQD